VRSPCFFACVVGLGLLLVCRLIFISSAAGFLVVAGLGLCRLSLPFGTAAGLACRELLDLTSSVRLFLTDGLGLSLALPAPFNSTLLLRRGGLSPLAFFGSPPASFLLLTVVDFEVDFLSAVDLEAAAVPLAGSLCFFSTVFFGVSSTFLVLFTCSAREPCLET
jgi:hypothetical protein